jgi:putative DNA primase/helicase
MSTIDPRIMEQAEAAADEAFGNGKPKNENAKKGKGPRKKRQAAAQENSSGADSERVHCTDLGNSIRLVARHECRLRYCHSWKKWLAWDGMRWRIDNTGQVAWAATETIVSLFEETAQRIQALSRQLKEKLDEHEEARLQEELSALTRLLKWCIASESAGRIAAMIELAKSRPGIPIQPADMDRDVYLLNLRNGTLDLRTGTLRPHDPGDVLTKLSPVEFDPEAKAPRFYQFLTEIFATRIGLIPYLRRFSGLCLTGDVSEQLLHIFWGIGANGKSVLLNLLLAMLGEDYAIKAAPELLMQKRSETHPTERADLHGKRLVVAIESAEGGRLAEALVKDLTGGDRIRARRMREDFWEFSPTHKIILCTNHKPRIVGSDHAIWRRVRLVPFEVVIPDEKQDKHLLDKLKEELAGILAWCVQGFREWQQDGLTVPREIKTATDSYRSEQDTLAAFIEECCFVHSDTSARAADLYAVFRDWAKRSGEKEISKRTFGLALGERGFQDDRGTGGTRMWKGIDVRAEYRSEASE